MIRIAPGLAFDLAPRARPAIAPPTQPASLARNQHRIADVLQTRARGRRQRFTAWLAQGEGVFVSGGSTPLRLGYRMALARACFLIRPFRDAPERPRGYAWPRGRSIRVKREADAVSDHGLQAHAV